MEPRGPGGRQAGVNQSPSHAHHEPLDIAALAAGDLDGPDRDRVGHLIDSCEACRAIFSDLQAIAMATRTERPAIPTRRVDFRLSDEDAARLASRTGRLLAWLAGSGGAFSRPLAAGLATLGVAAIVLSSVPLPLAGSAASSDDRTGEVAAEASQGTPPALAPGGAPAPQFDASGVTASPVPSLGLVAPADQGRDAEDSLKAATTDVPSGGPLPIIGIVLIAAAIVLFAVRPVARRLARRPT